MIRKLLVVAAAIAMPVSVIAITGGAAGAKTAPTGPGADSIHCTTESATVSFSIPLTLAGSTSGTQATTVSGTVSGCSVTGPTPEAVTGGTISGTLTAKKAGSAKKPTATCTGLLGVTKESGTLTINWSGVTIPASSTSVKSATGGTNNTDNGTFAIAGKPVSGSSFEGSDKGKSSSLGAQTVDTVTQLTDACEGGGISSLAIEATSTGITLS
jgi:hypothetical protein